MAELITCVYCLKGKESSREHLIQRGIGGNLVGRRVCKECNHRMSAIDQHLADNAVVSMLRVLKTPAEAFGVKLGGDHVIHDSDGRALPVDLRNQFKPEIQPHFRFSTAASDSRQVQVEMHLADPSDAARFIKYLRRLRERGTETLHAKTVDWFNDQEAALVMHRRQEGYLALKHGEDAEKAKQVIERGAAQIIAALEGIGEPEPSTIPKPAVEFNSEVRLNDLFRAVAKIGFNLLVDRTPDAVALDPSFNDLRAYILGDDVRQDSVDGVPCPDSRFVTWLVKEAEPLTFRDYEHVVVLLDHDSEYHAIITLYGSLAFTVRLGPTTATPSAWENPQVAVARADRQESRWLELMEIAQVLKIELPPSMRQN